MKYKKLLAGYPYVREPHFTKGFEVGVGYFKNLCKHQPVWVGCGVYLAVSSVALGVRYYYDVTQDPDVKHQYKNRYTVMRKEDVKDPTKECYN